MRRVAAILAVSMPGGRLPDEPLRLAHCLRPAREDGLDDRLGRLARVLGDLRHEPDPERNLRVEALAGEEVAASGLADLRKHERRDDRGDDPQPNLGEAEDRVGPRDGDVRARDEARAAAERVAVHHADDGRRARVDGLEHPVQAHRVLDVLLVGEIDGRALPLDVRTCAEARALAREDDCPRVADVRERLGQRGDELRVERVPALGPSQRDPEDAAVSLAVQRAHRGHHKVSPVSAKTFTVELERVQKTGTMFRVPFDLAGAFGRARPPVKVTMWAEAKREETRARRIEGTVERARAGKPPR